MELLVFYLFASISVVTALCVVLVRRAVYGALFLIVCLASLAVLFFQLGAPFIAAIQVIVYAGAIMVLFLFVVMLLDPQSEVFAPGGLSWIVIPVLPAVVLLGVVLIRVLPGLSYAQGDPGGPVDAMQNTVEVARRLFREYLLPFEVTSILILAAVVGAIVLTRRRTRGT